MMDTLKICCCYAPEDKVLMEHFHAHLRVLELQHVSIWYTHTMLPGMEWERERDRQLQAADIILFLVSADFIGSEEHYKKEVLPAMERRTKGEVYAIPIILRPANWRDTSLGSLFPLPRDGKPITDAGWQRQDNAFVNVVEGIKRVIQEIVERRNATESQVPIQQDVSPHASPDSAYTNREALSRLEQIIGNFRVLHEQVVSIAYLRNAKEVTLEGCEKQYNKLYGDTMIFLTEYLPECLANTSGGFVETVYNKTAEQLRKDNIFDTITVFITRRILFPLAALERLGMQVKACMATLELYKQKYFPTSGHLS